MVRADNTAAPKPARIAVRTALDFLEAAPDPFDSDALRLAVSVADEAVEADEDAGFSTLIVLVCDEDKVAGASVGEILWFGTSCRAAKWN